VEKERVLKSLAKAKEQAQWAIWSIDDFLQATVPAPKDKLEGLLSQAETELKDALLALRKAQAERSRS